MQKLRFYSLPLFLIFFALTVSAQGMTDDQVMKYIIKEHSAGTSQAQIVSNLMKKGVDIDQIRRIRKKYEKDIQEKSLGAIADKAVDNAGQMMRQSAEANQKNTQKLDGLSLEETEGGIAEEQESALSKTIQNKEMLFHGNRVFGRDIFNNTSLTF